MDNNLELVFKSKKVLDFYKKYPNIDIERMNEVFIDIMETLNENMNKSLDSSLASQIINSLSTLKTDLTNINTNISKFQGESVSIIESKFSDLRKDYIENLKNIVFNNTIEKMVPFINDHTNGLFDKTTILLNDILPKHDKGLSEKLHEIMQNFNLSTKEIIETNKGKENLGDLVDKIDSKLLNSYQLINNLMCNTDTKIKEIKDDIAINNNKMNDFMNKLENSSCKGKISENILSGILHSLYPTAEIKMVGEQKETGDIMLYRKDKPTILIENKIWNKNIVQDEVKKFIRDVETQKCCGLFLSQNFGIANKENFEINVNDNDVLVYIHEVNNDPYKIKTAIDIIDHFKSTIDETAVDDGTYCINKDLLDEINKEYNIFVTQQLTQIKNIKDFSQKMIKQIEDSQLPMLKQYLSTKYAFSTSEYYCEVCNYFAKNQMALAAHKRGKECRAKYFALQQQNKK
tara:strand:+ start:1971 stop:3353 length:1383 start_codon:yes stop_codon:yes gene_type:complete